MEGTIFCSHKQKLTACKKYRVTDIMLLTSLLHFFIAFTFTIFCASCNKNPMFSKNKIPVRKIKFLNDLKEHCSSLTLSPANFTCSCFITTVFMIIPIEKSI